MYRSIAGISINGKCFKNESKLNLFSKESERISIIYGKNGSGKSTIAEALSAYKHGDSTKFTNVGMYIFDASPALLSDEDKQNIFVFDEKYIEDSIRLREDGLSTIVMLGEQVDLDKKIDDLEAVTKRHKEDEKNQNEVCKKYKDSTNPNSPNFYYEAIKATLKKAGGWAETDSKIKLNKTNSSVTDTIIRDIVSITPSKTLAEVQSDFEAEYLLFKQISDDQEKYTDEIKEFLFDKNIDKKVLTLLSKTIEKPNITYREKDILDAILKGCQNRVEAARESFSRKDINICPYCYQPVSEKYKAQLIDSIEKVLNKDVDEHKDELQALIIKAIEFDDAKYFKLDNTQREKVRIAVKSCNDIIEKYNSKIGEKISSIYTPIPITDLNLSGHISALNQELAQLENLRIAFNKAIGAKIKTKSHLINLNKQIARHSVDEFYKQYEKQIQDKKIQDNKLSDIGKYIIDEIKLLEELKQKKKSVKIALDYINRALEYVFFCKGRLTLEAKNDIYYLKSHGNPVKPVDISSGERNIIALCYFFTQILNNLNEKEAFKKKYLLIIDDPVSSFDLENKVGIQSYIKSRIQKILFCNEDSRVILLSHDLGAVYDFQRASEEISQGVKGYYATWELKDKSMQELNIRKRHEYTSLIEMVYKYAIEEDIQKNELIIGNVMRRVLEAFSTFEYKKGISQISCDIKILNSLNNKIYAEYFENLMYRLVMHGESHYEEAVKTLPDMNFYSSISSDEKVRTAKETLCFMYLLNPNHIESHLSGIAEATKNINGWCKDILSPQTLAV